jgi:hypothetical protein
VVCSPLHRSAPKFALRQMRSINTGDRDFSRPDNLKQKVYNALTVVGARGVVKLVIALINL